MSTAAARHGGDVLDGRYRLVERLGRGGFGDVWRAEELLPDGVVLREVALKLLHEQPTDSADWSEEARIIASFRHPALVTIYAAGLLELDRERPCPFVAMELLLGETLAGHVQRGEQVPWRRVLWWALQAAAALDEIHRAGVVHLDLKPANLFLAERGTLKVLDFGIARRGRDRGPASRSPRGRAQPTEELRVADVELGDLSTAEFVVAQQRREAPAAAPTGTVTRSIVGTPGYMAPEILEDAEASPAADAYALAVCIVQLITGRLPQQVRPRPGPEAANSEHHAWFAEVQAATLRGTMRELRAAAPALPEALACLLERWLSLDPHARGVERVGLHAALDDVWRCPYGWAGNPYRGLEPYRSEDEGKLFGRDDDVARLSRELELQGCLVLHGAEGIGLRSLALAGVVPALGHSFADGRDDWSSIVVELGAVPDASLAAALEPWSGEPLAADAKSAAPQAAEGAQEGTASRPLPKPTDSELAEQRAEELLRWTGRSRVGTVLVLIGLERLVDAEPAQRRAVLKLVERLASQRPEPGLRLVATLREERTAELLALETVGSWVRPWLRFLGPPAPAAVAQLVREPARRSGVVLLDAETVEQELRRELQEDGLRLPFVSLALRAWYAHGLSAGKVTGESWQAAGGMLGALGRHADGVLGALEADERLAAEHILLRLVSADGRTVVASIAALEQGLPEDVRRRSHVLEQLVAAGLVSRRLDQVRLAHPKLPESWPRLRELRMRHMERMVFLDEVRSAARRWVDEGRPRASLWRGARLRELGRRAPTLRADLGPDELAFLAAGRRSVVQRVIVQLLAIVAVVLCAVVAVELRDTLERRAREEQAARRLAERREAVARMVTRSRRADDPYQRVALLGAAISLGSDDPLLPLELAETGRALPQAYFLSLEPVERPEFPWGDRWLVGGGSGRSVTLVDFTPLQDSSWGPLVHRFRPHPQGNDELVAFPFDSSFVTRGLDGQLRVWRVRLTGEVALAAVSPMRCVGGLNPVIVAARAPVVACSTEEGIARWDLRQVTRAQTDPFQGRVLHLSDDGAWVAAARLGRVLLWQPDAARRFEIDAEAAPSVARFSPRDDIVALVRPLGLELLSLAAGEPTAVWSQPTSIEDPVDARWDERGVDLAVCDAGETVSWHYLRHGGRAESDGPAPATTSWPCAQVLPGQPKRLRNAYDYGELGAVARGLGPRQFAGGWKLGDGRFLTHDLVLFDPRQRASRLMLQFSGTDAAGQPEVPGAGDAPVWVERDGKDRVVWQIGHEIRIYQLDGKRVLERPGHMLASCPDGKLLAWRRRESGVWELFAARHGVHVRDVPREPALLLGVDPSCATLFLQRLDGTLGAVDLAARDGPVEVRTLQSPGGWVLGGYVYDVRPSAGSSDPAHPVAPGLWLAASDGAMVRLEGPQGEIRPYGHATPRATAMADGPSPGDLLFADATGVVVRSRTSAADRPMLDASGSRVWEDLQILPSGRTMLLAAVDRVAVLDMERRQIVDELDTGWRGRLAPWDEDGSVLVWGRPFDGGAVGEVIPFGRNLAVEVAAAVSNLTASLGPNLELRLQTKQ